MTTAISETIYSIIPLWMVLLPLLCGGLILVVALFSEKATRPLFLLAGAAPAVMVPFVYIPVSQGKVLLLEFLSVLHPVGLVFRVDSLSLFMLLLFCFFGPVLFIYTLEYARGKPEQHRLLGAMALCFTGCLGVALAGNLLTFFLFFEFMSIMFFIAVAYERSPESLSASLKFLFMTIIGGVSLFLAIVLIYNVSGTLDLGRGGIVDTISTPTLMAFVAFTIAFGIKSAMLPLHLWMPDAYSAAPIPAATLSSTMLLKTGAYGFIRVFYDIYGVDFLKDVQWNYVILVISCVTILYGSINAIAQDDLVRRLAYSGIAQIGYIILGISLLNESGFIGNAYHIFAHAFMKGCLFLCAGAILVKTGLTKISEMKGIGLKMPVTMMAFTIAAITAVGIPPFNVFVTKWHLSLGALEAGQPLIIILLLVSSLLNAAYYLPIAYCAFLGSEAHKLNQLKRSIRIREASWHLLGPIVILALGCMVFTLAPHNWPLELVRAISNLFYPISL